MREPCAVKRKALVMIAFRIVPSGRISATVAAGTLLSRSAVILRHRFYPSGKDIAPVVYTCIIFVIDFVMFARFNPASRA